MSELKTSLAQLRTEIDGFLLKATDQFLSEDTPADRNLKKSIQYSLLQNGKRFRPSLCLLTAQTMDCPQEKALPFAAAIEMIHTYSLIHDDLPCMDNDDFRRGQPTNHKVFGESTALLAGDCLLTLSFELITEHYAAQPELALKLIRLLAQAAGFVGMIGGQAVDLNAKINKLSDINSLLNMHARKTGAMIRVCTEGAALIALANRQSSVNANALLDQWRSFGEKLGLAFQIKDDLLDSAEHALEEGSIPELLGIEQTHSLLKQTQQEAANILAQMNLSNGLLLDLLNYNFQREH